MHLFSLHLPAHPMLWMHAHPSTWLLGLLFIPVGIGGSLGLWEVLWAGQRAGAGELTHVSPCKAPDTPVMRMIEGWVQDDTEQYK